MKTSTGLFTLLAAAALLAAGCKDDDPAYLNREPDPAAGEEIGFLSAAGMSLRVVADTDTETMPDDTGSETERPSEGLSSRAAIDTDTFRVEILDADGASVYSGTYGGLQAELPMTLPVGGYTIRARSEDSIPGADWEHPVYGNEKSFSISKGATTQVGEIRCTLQNIKVTLEVSADLADRFSDDTAATVSLGGNSLVFPVRGSEAGYYLPVEELNTLHFALSGTFAASQSPVQFTKDITGVKAGQWRKITLVVTYADKGEVKFDVSVDSFVQTDDPIVINGTAYVWERLYEEQPLVEMPTVVCTDHDLAEPLRLTASMFDEENRCTVPLDFVLAAPGLIERVQVDIDSTNGEFLAALDAASVTRSIDLCAVEAGHAAYTLLSAFGFPLGAELKGAASRSFSLAGALPLLYNRPGYAGTHTFSIALTDAEGQTAQAALTVVVGDDGGPSVVWEGYTFDAQTGVAEAVVTEDLQVDITFYAPAGIRSLQVTIESATLTPGELASVGIPAAFDLADIQNSEDFPDLVTIFGTPRPDGFGFPINEAVRDQTEVPFVITPFVPLLINGGFLGVHLFHLDVTDNDGTTIRRTVKLEVK